MNVYVEKIKEKAKLPFRGSDKAAGYDLCACLEEDVMILPGETKLIGTGLKVAPPEGYFGAIFARSGLASKHGLRPANCVGLCDEDYRGEYMVALHNDSSEGYAVRDGERVAQLVFLPYLDVEFCETELDATERGTGGFGSTGK